MTITTGFAVIRAGFGADAVPYEQAWEQQRRLLTAVSTGAANSTMILLEHPPTFTAGRRTQPEDRPTDGTPVIDVDRGGRITWHGPGQLVGYPILLLRHRYDVVGYVRALERGLIDACAEIGLRTERIEGRSGVWVPADVRGPARKVAAIGVRVSRGVTMHGFALNCNADLSWFERIVPCGISDAGVTNLTDELMRTVRVPDVLDVVEHHLGNALAPLVAGSPDAVLD